jgi:hypothetical protein
MLSLAVHALLGVVVICLIVAGNHRNRKVVKSVSWLMLRCWSGWL